MDFFLKPSVCLILALFVIEVQLAIVPLDKLNPPPYQKYIYDYHTFIDNGYVLCKDITASRTRIQDLNSMKALAPEHKESKWVKDMRERCDAGIEETNNILNDLTAMAEEWVKDSKKRVAEKNVKKADYGHLKDIPNIFGPSGRCPLKK